ncbi:sigma-70 family RNA polymerase sigma factor [Lederbergia wuyishanensis]|uniref:DNA-directed RNA polymerase n=1 Tax=Lederbergia wuyishanensis TaxID=1347903 RepID=A0ABU0D9P8_9BACI|nr:sigma-70 family RNA polymerase sigma factor [Lederbergia wuyishanensis]MCJ8007411.1 sigma-70 family RNA polymerase sigma factor [Lederbergia wuyishanensis]MDQ0345151.1 DNA-directed RNA polymerase [Lederbergia wuyishanensis]
MERECFYELVNMYERMIFHVMKSLGIYKNREEFYQTGLIALWDAKQRFHEERGKFSTFAYSYIKGRMQTEMTKMNRDEERVVYPDDAFWEMSVDENKVEALELEQLDAYCKGLTERQRGWVIATFYFGMSTQEIADKEGVSLSAVKKWRTGAIQNIRVNMKEGIIEL